MLYTTRKYSMLYTTRKYSMLYTTRKYSMLYTTRKYNMLYTTRKYSMLYTTRNSTTGGLKTLVHQCMEVRDTTDSLAFSLAFGLSLRSTCFGLRGRSVRRLNSSSAEAAVELGAEEREEQPLVLSPPEGAEIREQPRRESSAATASGGETGRYGLGKLDQ